MSLAIILDKKEAPASFLYYAKRRGVVIPGAKKARSVKWQLVKILDSGLSLDHFQTRSQLLTGNQVKLF